MDFPFGRRVVAYEQNSAHISVPFPEGFTLICKVVFKSPYQEYWYQEYPISKILNLKIQISNFSWKMDSPTILACMYCMSSKLVNKIPDNEVWYSICVYKNSYYFGCCYFRMVNVKGSQSSPSPVYSSLFTWPSQSFTFSVCVSISCSQLFPLVPAQWGNRDFLSETLLVKTSFGRNRIQLMLTCLITWCH